VAKSKKFGKINDILYVKWDDHCSQDYTWTTKENVDTALLPCETVGFLVHEDDEKIMLANSKYCEKER